MKNVVNSDILKNSEIILVQRDNSEFNINDEKEVNIVNTSKRRVM